MDNINPNYYKDGIETIDYLESKVSREAFEGFLACNCIKYLTRYKKKNGIEDLNKTKWYLERLISTLTTTTPSLTHVVKNED